MSFEGYYQVLCKRGHYTTFDVYMEEPEHFTCAYCGSSVAWWNMVDVTNGSYDIDTEGNEIETKRIDGYVELKQTYIQSCKECHRPTEILYEIPKKKGHLIK